ncbi:MAG: radical SAM protein [Gloeomargaritaceae cyanobacterium C42_A2020_066]|nr:radical SAM protein [Gloeomargaritaceae cyanobacterium C42_A2020_066]
MVPRPAARPDAIPTLWAFPNTYSVGITSLGYQWVWALLLARPDLRVHRLFTDCYEDRCGRPELLGFSVSWELDYVHILDLLEWLDIPLQASERQAHHPLVFGGGPVLSANPEPYADFFDVVLLGDAEVVLGAFIDAYQMVRDQDRDSQLQYLAQVPGLYVPQAYTVSYTDPTGPVAAIQPLGSAPATVARQVYRGNTLATSTVVTPQAAWENIYLVEVVRSCPEMCRFCLASYLTLPFRSADLGEGLIPALERGLEVTDRIGLLGASVTQHPEFPELLALLGRPAYDHVRLSLASVRASTVTLELAETLARRGSHSLTIAVESGSERLRQVINKKLDQAAIHQAAQLAQAGGLKGLKLYGMVGLPTETEADIEATVQLLTDLRRLAPRLRLTLGCSTFVPKAQTPFQWQGVDPQAEKRLQRLSRPAGRLGVEFRPESYRDSLIQALLSRGDRRLNPLLRLTRHYGDSLGSYRRAFKELRGQLPPLEHYVHACWDRSDLLPWQHLTGTLTQSLLTKHHDLALAEAQPLATARSHSL